MKRTTFKIMTVALASLVLASCGPLIKLPGSGQAPSHYTLHIPLNAEVAKPLAWKIFLDEPRVPGMLRVDRIGVKSGDREMQYLANARWADRTPELLQAYWIEFLRDQGFQNTFGGDDIEILTDHNLRVTVLEFQAEVVENTVIGHVRLDALLLKNRPVEPVARQGFEATSTHVGASHADIVAGLNDALDDASRQMAVWLKSQAPKS